MSRLPLTEEQERLLLKAGEEFEKQNGRMEAGAYKKIAEKTTLVVGYNAAQVQDFFSYRKKQAAKIQKTKQKLLKRKEPTQHLQQEGETTTSRVRIKDCRAYNVPKPSPTIYEVVKIQQQELHNALAQLSIKENQLENKHEEAKRMMKIIEGVSKEMEAKEEEIKFAKARNTQLSAELAKKSAHVQTLDEEVQKIHHSESQLKDQVQDKQDECEALKKQIEESIISGETKLREEQEKQLAQLQDELEDQKKGLLQLNRELREKEDFLKSQQSQLEKERQRFQKDYAERNQALVRMEHEARKKAEERRRLEHDVECLQQELEYERAKVGEYEEWDFDDDEYDEDNSKLRKMLKVQKMDMSRAQDKMIILEDELAQTKQWGNSLRAENREFRAEIKKLDNDIQYYKNQAAQIYESQLNSAKDLDYYRRSCDYKDQQIRELQQKIQQMEKDAGPAQYLFEVIWRATKLESLLKMIIPSLVDEGPLRAKLLTRGIGLSVKIRYIAEYCFVRECEKRPNDIVVFHFFSEGWDRKARFFCKTRNDASHEFKYFENMPPETINSTMKDYVELYEFFNSYLEDLLVVTENEEQKRAFFNSRSFPSEKQTKARLSVVMRRYENDFED